MALAQMYRSGVRVAFGKGEAMRQTRSDRKSRGKHFRAMLAQPNLGTRVTV